VFQYLERPQVNSNSEEKTTVLDDWSYINGLLDEIKLSLPLKNFSDFASSDCREFENLHKQNIFSTKKNLDKIPCKTSNSFDIERRLLEILVELRGEMTVNSTPPSTNITIEETDMKSFDSFAASVLFTFTVVSTIGKA
jgi:hypothetical protein